MKKILSCLHIGFEYKEKSKKERLFFSPGRSGNET